MRANQGISSSSAEPEIIGFVRKAAPVAGLADASAVIDVTTPLVGEAIRKIWLILGRLCVAVGQSASAI